MPFGEGLTIKTRKILYALTAAVKKTDVNFNLRQKRTRDELMTTFHLLKLASWSPNVNKTCHVWNTIKLFSFKISTLFFNRPALDHEPIDMRSELNIYVCSEMSLSSLIMSDG